MLKYINEVVADAEKRLNIPIMTKAYDLPLIEYIKDVWKSLEVVKNIQILGFDYNEDESEIDINRYIRTRRKTKSSKEFLLKKISVKNTCCSSVSSERYFSKASLL